MNNTKKMAFVFLKSFGITTVTADVLKEIIKKQGYSIFEYSYFGNSPETEELLNSLNLKQYSLNTKAFTYADKNNRIVFILEGLSCEEQLILLAHEEGHIYLNHMNIKSGVFGDDILKDQEANNFAFCLMDKNILRGILLNICIHSKVALALVAGLLVLGILIATLKASVPVGKMENDSYMVTTNGTKYHKESCYFVRNNNKVIHLKMDDLNKLGYTPCQYCIWQD